MYMSLVCKLYCVKAAGWEGVGVGRGSKGGVNIKRGVAEGAEGGN